MVLKAFQVSIVLVFFNLCTLEFYTFSFFNFECRCFDTFTSNLVLVKTLINTTQTLH